MGETDAPQQTIDVAVLGKELKFPRTAKGLKDVLVGENSGDSLIRVFASLAITALPGFVTLYAQNPAPSENELKAWFVINGLITACQAANIFSRGIVEADKREAKREKAYQKSVKEQTSKLEQKLNPIATKLVGENQAKTRHGLTAKNIYSGNPLPGTQIVGIDLYLWPEKGSKDKHVVLELKEQVRPAGADEGVLEAHLESIKIEFKYRPSGENKLLLEPGYDVDTLRLANKVLVSAKK